MPVKSRVPSIPARISRTDCAQNPGESERKLKFPVVIKHPRAEARIYDKSKAYQFYG
jgi:hypothetical protein